MISLKYRVSDLSKILDVSSNTIRRFEKMGYISPGRNENKVYRTYSNSDIDKIISIEMCRKYRFKHKEIADLISGDLDNYIELSKERERELAEEIEYLTNVKERLGANIRLINRCMGFKDGFVRQKCSAFSYVLFRNNVTIFREPERMDCLHEFMYSSLPVQSICIFGLEALLKGKLEYSLGIAAKTKYLLEGEHKKTEYILEYPARDCLHFVVRVDDDFDVFFESNTENLFADAFKHMDGNGLAPDGDVLGITIANVIENKVNVQYILMSVPTKEI